MSDLSRRQELIEILSDMRCGVSCFGDTAERIIYETLTKAIDLAQGLPSEQHEVTEEEVKEYCRKRCLSIVDSALLKKYASAQPDTDKWCTDCKEYDQEHHCCPRWNRVIKTTLADAQQWIPVSELPNDNREVEVTCEVKRLDGKKYRYTCHASYVHRYSIESTGYNNWEECDEYNEEEDMYYALPGWYERVHNWDEYSYCAIEDYVLAWRELPEPFKGEQE